MKAGKENNIVGSPLWIAPQMSKSYQAGPYSDLWSLGVITYELFVGHDKSGQ